MKKLYPSSAAFMIGDTVLTKYDSGCLRSIMIRSTGIRTGEIPEVYQRVGAAHEAKHEADLKASDKVKHFQREVRLSVMLSPTVEYSGRMDFLVWPADELGAIVDETKGCISKNTRRDVIRKGEFNVSYLAQNVSYMVKMRTVRGRMVHGYYEEAPDGSLVFQEGRTYRVTIEDNGDIFVDGAPSSFNVADLLAHQRAAVGVIESGAIASRPDKWNQKWGGPCTMCPFKRVCDEYDAGTVTDKTFMDEARIDADRAIANGETRKQPEPFKIKVKAEPKVRKPRKGAK